MSVILPGLLTIGDLETYHLASRMYLLKRSSQSCRPDGEPTLKIEITSESLIAILLFRSVARKPARSCQRAGSLFCRRQGSPETPLDQRSSATCHSARLRHRQ